MRLLCAGLLTLGLCAATATAQKDPPKSDRAEKLKTIQAKFDADFAELIKKFEKAATPAEKAGIRTEAKELMTLTAGKAVAVAAEDPKDPVALDAAEFIITRLASFGGGPDTEKAVGIVAEHHINSPKVKRLVLMASQTGPSGQKLLKAAAEKSTDNDVKGLSLYYLATSLVEQIEDTEDDKKVDELTAQATKYFAEAAKVAPEAKVGRETIAAKVKGDLEGLQAMKNLGVGKPAPDVEGTGLDGKKVKLSSYQGKVVLVDIWATWCPPCRAMIPHEREMVKKLADKPFVLVSVSADDEKDTLSKFIEKEPMPWTHWWDGGDQKVTKLFRVKAFPTLYLIDAKGVIRKKWVGSPGNEALDKAVEELVKEAEKK